MSKSCPECGKQLTDDAKFCSDCGHSFYQSKSNDSFFNTNKLFMLLIIIVFIVGVVFIVTFDGNNGSENVADNADHVILTINEVSGWDNDDSSSKKSYTLYTSAIFTSVPDDMAGYLIKTVYYDENDTQIGQETETLENIYYDSDYALSFGHYTTYNLPNPDYVSVEIIKDGKIVDNYTEKIDKNKIDYLN